MNGAESLLRTDRPAPSTRVQRPRISIVGKGMQLPPHAKAHDRFERGQRHSCNFANTSDTASGQLLRCDSADSPESLDGQRVQKREFVLWFDDKQPIGFSDATRDLGEKFRSSNPNGDWQPDTGQDLRPQTVCDFTWCTRQPPQSSHVEKCLVYRDAFDQWRGVIEYLEDFAAGLGVGLKPRRKHDQVRHCPMQKII